MAVCCHGGPLPQTLRDVRRHTRRELLIERVPTHSGLRDPDADRVRPVVQEEQVVSVLRAVDVVGRGEPLDRQLLDQRLVVVGRRPLLDVGVRCGPHAAAQCADGLSVHVDLDARDALRRRGVDVQALVRVVPVGDIRRGLLQVAVDDLAGGCQRNQLAGEVLAGVDREHRGLRGTRVHRRRDLVGLHAQPTKRAGQRNDDDQAARQDGP